MTKPPFRLNRQRGFSLVEIALALGIAGSALLVIFSMIPIGLSSLEDTGRQIVETEIFNKIGAELSATAAYNDPSSTVKTEVLKNYCLDDTRFPACFDVEGNELKRAANSSGTKAIPAGTVYQVRCGTPIKRPISGWSPATDGELLATTVSIGYHKDPDPNQLIGSDPAATPTPLPLGVRQRTFLLSNHGN